MMSEQDVATGLRSPLVTIGTDSSALRAEGILSRGSPHPRSYGTFPRVLGKYVRDEKLMSIQEAVQRMTGAAATQGSGADDPEHNMLATGVGIPGALMYGSLVDQDINCRAVGRCTYGDVIDNELLDMVPRQGPDEVKLAARLARERVPLSTDLGRAFLYARYNVDLSARGLTALGFTAEDVDPATAQKMDKADPQHIDLLLKIGTKAAAQVDARHFGSFV